MEYPKIIQYFFKYTNQPVRLLADVSEYVTYLPYSEYTLYDSRNIKNNLNCLFTFQKFIL